VAEALSDPVLIVQLSNVCARPRWYTRVHGVGGGRSYVSAGAENHALAYRVPGLDRQAIDTPAFYRMGVLGAFQTGFRTFCRAVSLGALSSHGRMVKLLGDQPCNVLKREKHGTKCWCSVCKPQAAEVWTWVGHLCPKCGTYSYVSFEEGQFTPCECPPLEYVPPPLRGGGSGLRFSKETDDNWAAPLDKELFATADDTDDEPL
jgi:hypothetical protein